ncbi:MAG: hypothetical protein R3B47_03430 [Bacteroidia bacterium]
MPQIQQIQQYAGHTGSIFALALDAHNQLLYSSGDDGIVACWDLKDKSGKATALLRMPHAVYGLEVIPEKKVLIAGASEGSLSFVDLETNKLRKQYARNREAIYQIKFLPDSNSIWILHGGGWLSVLDADSLEERFFDKISAENLRDVVALNGLAYVAASDGAIYVLDEKKQAEISRMEAHENSVFSLCMDAAGKKLFSGGRDAQLCVWDVEHGLEKTDQIPAHMYTINALALSPDEQYLVSASRDKTIKLWDVHSHALLKVIDHARHDGHTHSVNRILWLESDDSVISCGDDRRILRWKFTLNN